MNVRDELGSAVIEFITFVLVGQLLVLSGSIQLATYVDHKLKLELMAHQIARAEAIGSSKVLFESLKNDYQLPTVNYETVRCPYKLVCVKIVDGKLSAIGVSSNVG